MDAKILFVLPLEDRFKCPVHGGLFQEPVKGACGHNVCKACGQRAVCPLDGIPFSTENQTDQEIQDEIDELLCYCKYGVTLNANGELVTDSRGCDHIIKYGNRAQHESQCEFRDADFVMINESPKSEQRNSEDTESNASSGTRLFPCLNKDDGCFFLAETADELESHLSNECSYERLRRLLRQSETRVQLLEREIQLRDEEIADLRTRVAAHDDESNNVADAASAVARRTMTGGKEMWEEIVRIFEHQLLQGFVNAKAQLRHSPVLAKTSSSFTALKSKVMENTGKVRRTLTNISPMEKLSDINDKIAEMHPLDRLIALLSSIKNDVLSSDKEAPNHTESENNNSSSSSNSNDSSTTSFTPVSHSEDDDELVKRQIEASLATYEAEKAARESLVEKEAAAIAVASALSLADHARQH